MLIIFLATMILLGWHEKLPLLHSVKNGKLPFMVTQDSEWYSAMAKDGLAQIPSPFSKRVLYPWLAGLLSKSTGQSLPQMFLLLNVAALLTLAFCLAEILRMTIGKPFLVLLFLLTPFPLESLELAYLPDLFHMAIVSIFFLLLLHQKKKTALLILFLAFLTRENTLILCIFTAGLGWIRKEKTLSLGAVVVLIAGMMITSFFVKMGQPNPHHLPDFLYLFGKVPYYFLLNFFGIRIWSDVRPDVGTPFLTWHLPNWLKIGTDQTVGIVSPEWHYPIYTLITYLTIFGIGPLILFQVIRKSGKLKSLPFTIHLALAYGIFSCALGPLLGDWIGRLVGYSWPAFWIAMPALFYASKIRLETSQIYFLCAAYWISAWWPDFFGYDINRGANPWPPLAVIFIYLAAMKIFGDEARRNTRPQPNA